MGGILNLIFKIKFSRLWLLPPALLPTPIAAN
jgi:hypothetical protein